MTIIIIIIIVIYFFLNYVDYKVVSLHSRKKYNSRLLSLVLFQSLASSHRTISPDLHKEMRITMIWNTRSRAGPAYLSIEALTSRWDKISGERNYVLISRALGAKEAKKCFSWRLTVLRCLVNPSHYRSNETRVFEGLGIH